MFTDEVFREQVTFPGVAEPAKYKRKLNEGLVTSAVKIIIRHSPSQLLPCACLHWLCFNCQHRVASSFAIVPACLLLSCRDKPIAAAVIPKANKPPVPKPSGLLEIEIPRSASKREWQVSDAAPFAKEIAASLGISASFIKVDCRTCGSQAGGAVSSNIVVQIQMPGCKSPCSFVTCAEWLVRSGGDVDY